MTMRAALTLGVGLVLLSTAAWGQDSDPRANHWFRVSWEPRTAGGVPTIGGHVHNDSPYRVTDVRLRVEGLDADDQPVGRTFAWAIGDVVPGGEMSFVVETMPGAVNYRIAVHSYNVVSGGAAR